MNMTTYFLSFVVMATIVFSRSGQSAPLSQDDDDGNAGIVRSLSDWAGFPYEVTDKRYANNYFTNVKSKHYDRAAAQRFLQQRFLGKRFSPPVSWNFDGADISGPTSFQAPQFLGYLMLITNNDGPVQPDAA